MKNKQEIPGKGHWEPYLKIQVLPRCYSCHAPHPLASNNLSKICLSCGAAISELPNIKEVKPTFDVRFLNFVRKMRNKI